MCRNNQTNQENEMVANSHHTDKLDVSRWAHTLWFGLIVDGLIVGLAISSLVIGLIWSGNSVRYPGAEHQAAGSLSQQSVYQTSDDLPRVLRWYVRHFGLNHDMPQGDNCVTMTRVDQPLFLFLKQSITVTLCAHQKRTLIFVNRSFAMPR
jgi:hypothetical protein